MKRCEYCHTAGLRWHQSRSGRWFLVDASGELHAQSWCDVRRLGLDRVVRDVGGIDPLGWAP